MKNWIARESRIAAKNIAAGAGIAFFQRQGLSSLRASAHQVMVLVAIHLVMSVVLGFFESLPSPQFNAWGLANAAVTFCAFLFAGYVLALRTRNEVVLRRFVVSAYSAFPVFIAAGFLLTRLYHVLDGTPLAILWAVYLVWFVSTLAFIAFYLAQRRLRVAAPAIAIVFGGAFFLSTLQAPYWYSAEPDDAPAPVARINAESVFNSQFELLQDLQKRLHPSRHGTAELYFVGAAAYGGQDVFRREVAFIKNLFDTRFGTEGRSVALINHRETVDATPLATGSNLRRVLKILAQKMRRDDDVLFLYLTSHGGRNHKLAVDLWPLQLNEISPADLKAALDDAGIRWRVVLVSACYSGGFIAPFRDDNTLVMTAASADKQSFGCANEREFTYFGEAVFKEQLSRHTAFVPALNDAIDAIRERERKEKLNPSEPQLHVGSKIATKLGEIERRLFGAAPRTASRGDLARAPELVEQGAIER